MRLAIQVLKNERPYTGPELRPHFLLTEFGLKGSAIAAFIGPCEVKTESMVDWEDRLASDFIRAKSMLHFLGEFFEISLREGVLMQRLFMAIAAQEISAMSGKRVERFGDDLFIDGKKASVSIVTASPVSRLLHVGINIDASGAPVSAIGLQDIQVSPETVAERILAAFQAELESVEWACAKVRPVI